MSDQFVGEIRIMACNYAPAGWAQCNGQLMLISRYSALFSLLGTQFGGDGRVTFAVPNFQGNAPMHWGNGANLTPRTIGDTGGSLTATISSEQMPSHTHTVQMRPQPGDVNVPTAATFTSTGVSNFYYADYAAATAVAMNPALLGFTGGNQSHKNVQPYQGLNFCVALVGQFPPRS